MFDIITIGQRLKEAREKIGVNPRQFALKAGIDPSQYLKSEKGEKGLGPEKIKDLCSTWNINSDFIATGKGHIVLNAAGINDNEGKKYIDKRRALKEKGTPFMVPLIHAKAQAGYARSYSNIEFMNDLEVYPIVPGIDHRGGEWRYFEVEGDSMEPGLYENDFVLVSQVLAEDWLDLKGGQVYVVVTGEEVLIKIVVPVDRGQWILRSSNKRYKERLLPVDQVREMWYFRRLISNRLPYAKK